MRGGGDFSLTFKYFLGQLSPNHERVYVQMIAFKQDRWGYSSQTRQTLTFSLHYTKPTYPQNFATTELQCEN